MEKINQAQLVMIMGAKLKALIQILEKKGIITEKEIEEKEIKLIKEGLKKI